MDCTELSPNARKIFDEIKTHYLPDPWGNPQWKEEGVVYDNGWHDLRKNSNRTQLVKWYEHLIGHVIVSSASAAKNKKEEITGSVFNFKTLRRWIELAVLLYELDLQIETTDLVENCPQ